MAGFAKSHRFTPMLVALVAVLAIIPAQTSRGASQRVTNPALEGPVTGGKGSPWGGLLYNTNDYGYTEREYFFEGTAQAYGTSAPPAPYRTRMLVWAPLDAKRYNGTTLVEWMNVTGGSDLAADIQFQSPMLVAEGYAFAAVSAQEAGVCGQKAGVCAPTSLKGYDPERYGTLTHPGDAYAFDIFSQAIQAIRYPQGVNPLPRIRTKVVLAEGASQSAFKLDDYITNGADAQAQLVDGFLIDADLGHAQPERYRVPTIHHLSEDSVRREPVPDGPNHVTWEVAGASHFDKWASNHSTAPNPLLPAPAKYNRDQEEARRDQFDDYGQNLEPARATCAPVADAGDTFPRRFSLNAGTTALQQWVRSGTRAPAADVIQRQEAGSVDPSPLTAAIARDEDGNAIGGLRNPVIDVAVAAYNGEACYLFGITTPLAPTRLAIRYPSHASYVEQMLAATNGAVTKRYLICADAITIMRKASTSTIGGSDVATAAPACATKPKT